jgi:hypothetical protein
MNTELIYNSMLDCKHIVKNVYKLFQILNK